jgi:transposase-like protein
MPAPRKYPEELRERSVRLVLEAREEDAKLSLNAAVLRIGPRVGVNPDTLRGWCKQAEIDLGRRAGTTTSDAVRIKELEREVRELKRANEILLAASSFFARELVLDRRRWATRNELRIEIVTWIERTYHRRRRQARLGRLTPIEFEIIMTPQTATAA